MADFCIRWQKIIIMHVAPLPSSPDAGMKMESVLKNMLKNSALRHKNIKEKARLPQNRGRGDSLLAKCQQNMVKPLNPYMKTLQKESEKCNKF